MGPDTSRVAPPVAPEHVLRADAMRVPCAAPLRPIGEAGRSRSRNAGMLHQAREIFKERDSLAGVLNIFSNCPHHRYSHTIAGKKRFLSRVTSKFRDGLAQIDNVERRPSQRRVAADRTNSGTIRGVIGDE